MSETERILRMVIVRRSEIELIYLTTKSEKKRMNCIILMEALDKRQKELAQELEELVVVKKKSNWLSRLFK